MKRLRNIKGYTLIELLAVIVVITTVGGLITGIIVLSLRGSNRSTNVNGIRQSGNFALNQMSKMITYAQGFEGVATTDDTVNNSITYTNQCTDTDTQAKQFNFLKIRSFDQGVTTYICDKNADPQLLASYSGALSTYPIAGTDNTGRVNLVDTVNVINNNTYKLDQCYFTCIQNNVTIAPTIGIHFTVSSAPTNGLNSNLVENRVTIPFDLTVSIRNSGN